ncbi:hypothetical protein D1823_08360 [Ruegeria sp. AD91A]|uniref:hypothetical protein n=1 Tax=Ruegeria sp. AD91A TaxID=2293862 RepID=UPI000E472F78|nr:hypothetical protein [Ruegeria sp. AD91A]AXT26591.1 hypothetical protein D1823_08360 [Ruegeria sp. AD91A]
MVQYLDHDDFKKSRKAVIITSVSILLASTFEFSNQTLKILGLEAKFDIANLIVLLKLSLLYFFSVFLLKLLAEGASVYESTLLTRYESGTPSERLKKIYDDMASSETYTVAETDLVPAMLRPNNLSSEELLHSLTKRFRRIRNIASYADMQYFFFAQVLTPIALAFVAFWNSNALKAYLN